MERTVSLMRTPAGGEDSSSRFLPHSHNLFISPARSISPSLSSSSSSRRPSPISLFPLVPSLSRPPSLEISELVRLIVWLHHWKRERASALKSLCVCLCVCVFVCVCMRRVQVCGAESTITISLSFLRVGMPCMLDND